MSVFKKRETLIQNITYMAIMAAINVVFVLLTTLVPLLMFLIIFVLPLTSTVVALFCKKKYYPIYAIVTIGLCMLVTMWNISDTFFFVIPSILVGFLFAIMVEHNINSILIILVCSLLEVGCTYAFLPLINFIYNRNFINDLAAAFNLKDYKYLYMVAPAFILVISLIQSCFSYLVIKDEISKFGFKMNTEKYKFIYIILTFCILSILTIICAFFYQTLVLFLFILLALVTIYMIIELFVNINKYSMILLGVSFLLEIFLFAIIYKYIPAPLAFLGIGIFFVEVAIVATLNNYLFLRKKNKDTINTGEK